MIRIGRREAGKVVSTAMELAGQEFEIDLIPYEEKKQSEVLAKFRKTKNLVNPVSKRLEVITYFDDKDNSYQDVANELLDQLVRDFRGIGGLDGKALDGTKKENKVLLGSVQVKDVELIEIEDPDTKEKAIVKKPRTRIFRDMIFEKASELASTIAEAEEKNFVSSQPVGAAAGR